MKYQIEGRVLVHMEYNPGDKKSKVSCVDFLLELSNNLKRDQYFLEDGHPNQNGCQALTLAFIQGLASNIHYAHDKKFRDSAEHLRHVISELERAFIQVTKVGEGEYGKGD